MNKLKVFASSATLALFFLGFYNLHDPSASAKQGSFAVYNTQASGPGSLAQAIINANIDLDYNNIYFYIPTTDPGFVAYADDGTSGSFDPWQPVVPALSSQADPDSPKWWRIILPATNPAQALPSMNDDQTFLEGESQTINQGDTNPYGPEIEIIHSSPVIASGLVVNGSYCVIEGLSIYQITLNGDQNELMDNYLGTDPSGRRGSHEQTIGFTTIEIYGSGNILGEILPGAGNVINGGSEIGLLVGGESNLFWHNYIGVNATATQLIGTGYIGVAVWGDGNSFRGNVVGGSPIYISGNSNTLEQNFIGTDPTGNLDFGIEDYGVRVTNGFANTFGPGNLIYNNHGPGIQIENPTTITTRFTQNSISANQGPGIRLINGANAGALPPTIQLAFASFVSGITEPQNRVEIYSDPEDEGLVYEGSVVANSEGFFYWSGFATGPRVTAISSHYHNSSSFSAPLVITQNPIRQFLPLVNR